MNPGTITLRPDARLRDADGEVKSRDVHAVFVAQEVTIPSSDVPIDITVQAVPHIELEFEWVDPKRCLAVKSGLLVSLPSAGRTAI